ncbi:hypothetical protein QYS49_07845 [Marivirga salinae]|uniref:Uncharacterized protein n=1 Tax=Marivirga salinarum TaxID=3059078 RepID=A0AA49JBY4_9BACT|nr:hypothetical protein [Marivirga sp. BDSF4-3]WKK77113.1 hypothetical protein QYS49_07845 [Marivirga sp. BDSF4-3]
MFRTLIIISIILTLSSCADKENQLLLSQTKYLDSRISEVANKLDEEVEATNFRLEGVRLKHRKDNLKKSYDSISFLLKDNEIDLAKSKTKELITTLNTTSESYKVLEQSLNQVTESNKVIFSNNLALIVVETIQSYRKQFDDLFYQYDAVHPVLFDETQCLKAGQKYEGEIMMVAMKLSTERVFEADYPNDNQGFIKLPVSQSLGGKLVIDNLQPGQTEIKVRVTESHLNQKLMFENTVLLEPK